MLSLLLLAPPLSLEERKEADRLITIVGSLSLKFVYDVRITLRLRGSK